MIAGVLTLIVTAGAIALGLWRPVWLLRLLLVSLPFDRLATYSLHGHQLRLGELIGLGLIVSVTVRGRLRRPVGMRALAALAAAVVVSAALIHTPRIWGNALEVIFLALLFAAVAAAIAEYGRRELDWFIVGAVVTSAFGIYQIIGDLTGLSVHLTGLAPTYTKTSLGFPRLQSVASEPQYFASYLLVPLFLALGGWVRERRRGFGWTAAFLGLAFALTFSRGAFFAGLIGFGLFITLIARGGGSDVRRRLVGVVAGLVIIVVLSPAAAGLGTLAGGGSFGGGVHKVTGLFSTQLLRTSSYQERIDGKRSALGIIRQSPWFGVGIGRYRTIPANYPAARHNYDRLTVNDTYLQLACETGLVGLAAFVALIATLLWRGVHRALTAADPALIAVTAALLAISLQAPAFSGFFLISWWVSMATLSGLLMKRAAA